MIGFSALLHAILLNTWFSSLNNFISFNPCQDRIISYIHVTSLKHFCLFIHLLYLIKDKISCAFLKPFQNQIEKLVIVIYFFLSVLGWLP